MFDHLELYVFGCQGNASNIPIKIWLKYIKYTLLFEQSPFCSGLGNQCNIISDFEWGMSEMISRLISDALYPRMYFMSCNKGAKAIGSKWNLTQSYS